MKYSTYSRSVLTAALVLAAASAWQFSLPPSFALSRREILASALVMIPVAAAPQLAQAEEYNNDIVVQLTGDAKKIFGEGRALELQGNLMAAQRLYGKVTQMAPNFVYGWSSLGNTQTAFGDLSAAEVSYTKSIELCTQVDCSDQYVLYLNRGTIRLNTNRPAEALADLRLAATLRGRPDDIVLQNLARACELNGLYEEADRNYDVAIRMTGNQVSPYWLRAAMVKFQLNEKQQGYDLLKRIENRFPDAPEVKAASAVFLAGTGKMVEAQQKFLEISDRQRLKYVDQQYLTGTIAWPPAMLSQLSKITQAVGDQVSI
jgi:tetratricopeptide (TPR) repeat protein